MILPVFVDGMDDGVAFQADESFGGFGLFFDAVSFTDTFKDRRDQLCIGLLVTDVFGFQSNGEVGVDPIEKAFHLVWIGFSLGSA